MNARAFWLDDGPGERRGVVTLGGRPEHLLIERVADPPVQKLGARVVARIRSMDRARSIAFLDLGEGPDAVLNLSPDLGPQAEGGWIVIEVRSEARGGKGAVARWLGPAEGPLRLLQSGPDLEARLKHLAREVPVRTGPDARTIANQARDEALETIFRLPGGGTIAVEATRALTAVDVDLGERGGATNKRAARATNLAAISEASRVLRLKGMGGLVVMDLAGRGHDGAVLLNAARAAFAPDNPGVSLGSVSRFGTLELNIPRRGRPTLERLTAGGPALSAESLAFDLLRALEREAIADGGARLEGAASPMIVEAAMPFLELLTNRFGARFTLSVSASQSGFEVTRR